ncbi:NUDIX domain-containing protein [Streptomyces sp. MZ04]|uniref:NUDIX hydrolase n=1 Tax=Streptomyces sp. MZ04 TaxID=2559236 RepID=UPI00107EA75B|nr:NUDIX domain-containing protein [Streptomyces sp. MZ04]TGB05767.1 NUDIX hydrolase [Streptomyces sp. MZ04]
MSNPGHEPIRRRREVLAYANRFAEVFDDEVEFPDGTPGRYLRIAHRGEGPGVVILPVHGMTVGLVQTYRYPVGSWQWGLPRGFSHGRDPLVTARTELHEELGVQDADFELLGAMTPDSGMLATRVAIVLARVDDPTGEVVDVREVAAVRWLPIRELWQWVAEGRIEDGMSLAALTLAHAGGHLPGP